MMKNKKMKCVAAWTQRSRELKWKKRNLEYSKERMRFTWNADTSDWLPALEAPFQFFSECINEDTLTAIIEQTNLYTAQKNVFKCPPVNATEIRQLLAAIIFMSVHR